MLIAGGKICCCQHSRWGHHRSTVRPGRVLRGSLRLKSIPLWGAGLCHCNRRTSVTQPQGHVPINGLGTQASNASQGPAASSNAVRAPFNSPISENVRTQTEVGEPRSGDAPFASRVPLSRHLGFPLVDPPRSVSVAPPIRRRMRWTMGRQSSKGMRRENARRERWKHRRGMAGGVSAGCGSGESSWSRRSLRRCHRRST